MELTLYLCIYGMMLLFVLFILLIILFKYLFYVISDEVIDVFGLFIDYEWECYVGC